MKSQKYLDPPEYVEILDTNEIDSNSTALKYVINKKKLNNIILETIEIDRSFRYVGVDSDLFKIDDLKQKELDFIYPTLCNMNDSYRSSSKKTLNRSDIIERIYNTYPLIQGMNMDNILIAGGAICNEILGIYKSNDLDIFIYGVNEYNANLIIYRILHHFSTFEGYEFNFIKTINALTINIEKVYFRKKSKIPYNLTFGKIQIIFRLYKTKSEILHSFDMGSSCVGFDGNDILFTTLSKFSYEYDCNIVDNTRRSTTYEKRLIKYFKRGFKIIMPDFNIDALKFHKTYITLPKILISSFISKGNKITTWSRNIYPLDNTIGSDYDTIVYNVLYINIDALLKIQLTINWIKQDPSKMLSASHNPIEDTEITWYGMYLLKPLSVWARINKFIKKFKSVFCL